MQTIEIEIPFCSKKRGVKRKLSLVFICCGIPSLIFASLFYFMPSDSWAVLLIPLVILLSVLKTATALGHVTVLREGLVFKRGINRRWKRFTEPREDALLCYTSIKRGSTFVLNVSEESIISIDRYDPEVSSTPQYDMVFEDPDRSPFVMNENVLSMTIASLSFENFRVIHAAFRKYPKTLENVTVYFSVDSISEFYEALPKSLKRKTFVEGAIVESSTSPVEGFMEFSA